MKRLERLTAILSYMQGRQYSRMTDMVERFGVTERTLFRDIAALQESGVPIGFEKHRGYFILDRHFLPPMAFSLEEAKSFLFVEQLARKYLDGETLRHYLNALEKIRNKLSDRDLKQVEELSSRIGTYVDPDRQTKFLSVVETACDKKQVLELRYQDIQGKQSIREIEPVGITFYSQTWHVIAYCRLREDYRDFSLARIQQLERTGETFGNDHLTLNEYIKKLEANQTH